MFYPEGLVDFASEKSFIPKLTFFLLHRCVQKWLFAKSCPHFSFITGNSTTQKKFSRQSKDYTTVRFQF